MGALAMFADTIDVWFWVACVVWVAAGAITGVLAGRVLRSDPSAEVSYVAAGMFGDCNSGGLALVLGEARAPERSALIGSVVAAVVAHPRDEIQIVTRMSDV